jgi:hypothetical protein
MLVAKNNTFQSRRAWRDYYYYYYYYDYYNVVQFWLKKVVYIPTLSAAAHTRIFFPTTFDSHGSDKVAGGLSIHTALLSSCLPLPITNALWNAPNRWCYGCSTTTHVAEIESRNLILNFAATSQVANRRGHFLRLLYKNSQMVHFFANFKTHLGMLLLLNQHNHVVIVLVGTEIVQKTA